LKEIIEVEHLAYTYPGFDDEPGVPVFEDLELTIREGTFVAVLGTNGCGKSTLAKHFNSILLPTGGKVYVCGIDTANEDRIIQVRRNVGMVFQNPDNQIVATIVEEDCAFGLENMGVESGEIRRRVDEALKTVGMEEFALTSPNMLSRGQKQRVAIAGVVAMKPDIIVFDESTAMLDPVGRRDIFTLARRLNKDDGITIVWITHFMDEAVKADRVAVMAEGRLVMEGTPRNVFSRESEIRALGLDVPEMSHLAALLRSGGLEISNDIMTVEEMVVELCRSK